MRILAGEDTEFDGNLKLVSGVRVGYLPQEPILDDSATVLQNVETAVKPVKDMIKEFEDVSFCSAILHPKLSRMNSMTDAFTGDQTREVRYKPSQLGGNIRLDRSWQSANLRRLCSHALARWR